MELATITYIVVGLTFAVYMAIAIAARAGSTQEFYVAGGGIHPVANGMATAADWMSAASFISMAGLIGISYNGYGGSVFLMGWTGGYVILAMLVAPYLTGIPQSGLTPAWKTPFNKGVDVFFAFYGLVGFAALPFLLWWVLTQRPGQSELSPFETALRASSGRADKNPDQTG